MQLIICTYFSDITWRIVKLVMVLSVMGHVHLGEMMPCLVAMLDGILFMAWWDLYFEAQFCNLMAHLHPQFLGQFSLQIFIYTAIFVVLELQLQIVCQPAVISMQFGHISGWFCRRFPTYDENNTILVLRHWYMLWYKLNLCSFYHI